jgi:pimeloyl-ACP methyl ester carboxylesterase
VASAESGHFESGLPFNRFGTGPGQLVVFQGMQFENRPVSGLPLWFLRNLYKRLEADYTIHLVTRRPGLPEGWSLRDMSDDYATMIRAEFGGPVDIVGLSTGGLIAQHFAAEHPDLVGRLVLHSSAHSLSDETKAFHVRVSDLVREDRWRAAYATVFTFMSPRRGRMRRAAKVAGWLASPFGGLLLGKPTDPSDLLVTYAASNKHDFRGRLAEIKAPTLVVAGGRDPFYPTTLVRETAEGIPDAKLVFYEGIGHPASGKRFGRDVLSFLKEEA